MSTTFLELKGKNEVPNPETREVQYCRKDVHFTSFYGGKHRGKSLQIGFSSGGYVQLDEEQVKILIAELQNSFPSTLP